ncbi:MAG: hypothetical protein ACUZ8E_07265 [Candidatus Anammoxibacter sp.]
MDNWHKGLGGLLVLALIYILFLQQCGSKCNPEIIEVDTVLNVTVYDTTWYDTTRYKYLTVIIPKPHYDTIRIPAKILDNYFNEFDDFFDNDFQYPAIYEDTITNDTISIYYRAKVTGSLDEFTLGYKIYAPFYIESITTIQTQITRRKRFQGFYLGLDVGGNMQSFNHFAPMLELSTHRYNYNAGFNLMNKSVIVGMRVKIGKKVR